VVSSLCVGAGILARPFLFTNEISGAPLEPGEERRTVVVILIGVAGSGKSAVGSLLAAHLDWRFADADDYHPAANIEKMRSGVPLTDADRQPWLDRIRSLIASWIESGANVVLACSALKQAYRDRLQISHDVRFVYLKVNEQLLHQRLQQRRGHYMKDGMLESQLAALEEPADAISVDASKPPLEIVAEIVAALGLTC
jgi:gluconokinase